MREDEMRLEVVFERSVVCFVCLLPCSKLKEVDCDFDRISFDQDLEWVYSKLRMICLEAERTNGHQ